MSTENKKVSTKIKTKCVNCGIELEKKRSEFKDHGLHSCSRSCAASYRIKKSNPNPKKDKIEVPCESCGKKHLVFESVYKKNKWQFCSRECYGEFRSQHLIGENNPSFQGLTANCDQCNNSFSLIQSTLDRNKNVFCSNDCYWKYRSIHYSGENHNQFGMKKSEEQIEKMRIATTMRIANGEFPQTNTSIQIKVRDLVEILKLNFEEEIAFKYYVLDFYDKTSNLAIEVMGDYWHANPTKYESYEVLHDIQKKDIKRDKSKNTYLKKNYNFEVLYLWEKDINNNPELCKKLMLEYVMKKGILKEYNSYNYFLSADGHLELQADIILPFFMRINTKHQKLYFDSL